MTGAPACGTTAHVVWRKRAFRTIHRPGPALFLPPSLPSYLPCVRPHHRPRHTRSCRLAERRLCHHWSACCRRSPPGRRVRPWARQGRRVRLRRRSMPFPRPALPRRARPAVVSRRRTCPVIPPFWRPRRTGKPPYTTPGPCGTIRRPCGRRSASTLSGAVWAGTAANRGTKARLSASEARFQVAWMPSFEDADGMARISVWDRDGSVYLYFFFVFGPHIDTVSYSYSHHLCCRRDDVHVSRSDRTCHCDYKSTRHEKSLARP